MYGLMYGVILDGRQTVSGRVCDFHFHVQLFKTTVRKKIIADGPLNRSARENSL